MVVLVAAGALIGPSVLGLVSNPPNEVGAQLLSRGVEGAEIAVSMVALAVCTTLLLRATTAGYVARRLGLLDS